MERNRRSEEHTAGSTWSSEEHTPACTWKCADPNCNEVNYGEEETCVKCNLSRDKSALHRQKLQVFREFTAKKPTNRNHFKCIRGTKDLSVPSHDVGVSNVQEGKVKAKLHESKLFAQHVEYQPVNHRVSSIVHKYRSVMASRGDREKKMDGVKYVLQVSLKTEISNLTKALGKVTMQKVGSNTKVENRMNGLKSLGVELEKTLKAVDLTRLASIYDEASALESDDCGKSRLTDAEVLETVTSDYNKFNTIDRRVERFKRYLNRIANTLENIKMGIGSTSVPDVEEAIRKLEECLEYPVLNMDQQMVLWSKFKIEEILDDVFTAWNVLQNDGDCEVKTKLKQIENPLVMFGSKYRCYDRTGMKSEHAMKDHRSSKLGENTPWEEKQLKETNETPVQPVIVRSTKPIKWSTADLRKNTSTPNSTILVEESEYLDAIQTEEEQKGFYDSSYDDCNEFDTHTPENARDDFVVPKEEAARDEVDSCKEEITCDEFKSPKEEIANQSFAQAKQIKNTETGYMRVEELKKLIETYTNQHESPQVDNFLNSLDRDQDGWVLFEDFEAGLTSALLGCG